MLFTPFLQVIALSEALKSSCSGRFVAPPFSRNCGQKLLKLQKSAEKVCATYFVKITEIF